MVDRAGRAFGPGDDGLAHDEQTVTVCRTSAENFVFLELGNQDGWIATDTIVPSDP